LRKEGRGEKEKGKNKEWEKGGHYRKREGWGMGGDKQLSREKNLVQWGEWRKILRKKKEKKVMQREKRSSAGKSGEEGRRGGGKKKGTSDLKGSYLKEIKKSGEKVRKGESQRSNGNSNRSGRKETVFL